MYLYNIFVIFLAVFKLNCICSPPNVTVNLIWEQHNKYRKQAGMPELSLSKKLSKDCEDYAQHLVTLNIPDQELFWLDRQIVFNISNYVPDLGDHIAYPFSDKNKKYYTESICEFKTISCVRHWYYGGNGEYSRAQLFHESSSLADKYTAIVWRSSKKLGVGIVQKNSAKNNGRKILVVRYSPPGNVVGKYKENIPANVFEDDELEVETTTESKACEKKSYIFSKVLIFLTLTLATLFFKIVVVHH
ncbi:Golgi-associated plant pathogenesis-related protein 1-like [Drosophila subpulchrella]|uniref:Golgi-associated plant pathogenesis-related protein 1-like n=1 Tax=Drosophila subpulchrella TaxID=1486046 RepID=UPI0018A1684E|nr:Golgi-associated plant pathogenesis-related protein 1-like [Drosophila subpulchrella]